MAVEPRGKSTTNEALVWALLSWIYFIFENLKRKQSSKWVWDFVEDRGSNWNSDWRLGPTSTWHVPHVGRIDWYMVRRRFRVSACKKVWRGVEGRGTRENRYIQYRNKLLGRREKGKRFIWPRAQISEAHRLRRGKKTRVQLIFATILLLRSESSDCCNTISVSFVNHPTIGTHHNTKSVAFHLDDNGNGTNWVDESRMVTFV